MLTRPNLALPAAVFLVFVMAANGPVPQPANYHDFADQRALLGIPNAIDVLSNLGFLAAGVLGLLNWKRGLAFAVFFGALVLTGLGSAWYHLNPSDASLVWDRLPIAIACAALLASVLPRERLSLLLLVLAAIGSVAWWSMTGDLRPYLLIQGAPLVFMPILQWQRNAGMKERWVFAFAIGLYVLAKLCELRDHEIFALFDVVSGHSLKHVLASLAALVLVRYYQLVEPRP